MVGCEILDFRCLFINEIIGSITLAVVFGAIFYFIIASKLRFGFDTTIAFALPVIIIMGLAMGGFPIIYAFTTVIVAWMLGFLFQKLIGSR